MDFDDTPEEAAFRAEVRAFLESHTTPRTAPSRGMAEGEEQIARCKSWQRTLYDTGWAGITWPKAFGGRGGNAIQQTIYNQEQARFDAPTGLFSVGIGMVGPTLIAHGTDDQKARFLDGMLRGDDVWCQLFSEPGAGSDLASLGTRAVRDGDEWVVTGQKVWNSYAHIADWGALLARTDPDAPKHRGITFFLLDMRTPGIEVRPLRQITGVAHFNEVFLNEVRLPADAVVGEVNDGWRVAQTMLMAERSLIGGGAGQYAFADLLALAERRGRRQDPIARQDLARSFTRTEILRYLGLRVQTAISQGRMPGPESSVMKLFISRHYSLQGDLVMALEGAHGTLGGDDAWDDAFWQNVFLNQWASKIGGGTDQIQGNILGERVLGLPREPGPDRDTPWRELAKG